MQYCKFNKTSQTLIKCMEIGGTGTSEMFVDGGFVSDVLYAAG